MNFKTRTATTLCIYIKSFTALCKTGSCYIEQLSLPTMFMIPANNDIHQVQSAVLIQLFCPH